jgi:hypothetical protein
MLTGNASTSSTRRACVLSYPSPTYLVTKNILHAQLLVQFYLYVLYACSVCLNYWITSAHLQHCYWR